MTALSTAPGSTPGIRVTTFFLQFLQLLSRPPLDISRAALILFLPLQVPLSHAKINLWAQLHIPVLLISHTTILAISNKLEYSTALKAFTKPFPFCSFRNISCTSHLVNQQLNQPIPKAVPKSGIGTGNYGGELSTGSSMKHQSKSNHLDK